MKAIKNSIKLKFILPMLCLFVIAGCAIYQVTISAIKQTLASEFVSKGRVIASTMASSLQETLLNRDASTVQGFIDQYTKVEGISFILVLDEKKHIVAHTFYPKVPDYYLKLAGEIIEQKNVHNGKISVSEQELNGRRELVLSKPILRGLLGHVFLGMGIETREREIINPIVGKIIFVTTICIAAVGLLLIVYFNLTLQPIFKLTKVAEAFSKGKIADARVPVLHDDEIGKLTKAFNEMVRKLVDQNRWLEEEVQQRTDIIKEQQASLVYASKMSSLGEMAGGIAHEINTPLAIIGMKLEQMFDSIAEDEYEPEDFKKSLTVIKRTTDRIDKIIKGLRFFARDGSLMPSSMVDLNLIVEDTFSFCSEQLRHNEIKIEVIRNYDQSAGLFLNCRAVEISQVLLNLLNNASDAIVAQTDKEKWIKLIITDRGAEVEINVVDSGTGIPENIQDKITQPFFTTKEVGKGTGLGLSIARGIIDSHKGQFYIDNSAKNTTFTMVLPKGDPSSK